MARSRTPFGAEPLTDPYISCYRKQHELSACVSTLAYVECCTPVFEGERARDWNSELSVCGELRELAEHVVAHRVRHLLRRGLVLIENAAHAECGSTGEVDDGEYPARIAADNS